MRYAISVPPGGSVAGLVDAARATDEAGWDGFFVWDHLYVADGWPIYDPWVLLGAAAVVTSRVRLGAMVTPLPRRRPWKVAKEIMTLDHLSGGRAVAGVGLGAPDEDFTAFGESADPRARASLLDEGLNLLDAMLRGSAVRHEGRHFQVNARLSPACVQVPRPPIWVAATWRRAGPLKRAIRYDGVFAQGSSGPLTPAQAAEIREAVGPEVDVVVPFDRTAAPEAYAEAGVTWLVDGPEAPSDDWLVRLREKIEAGPPRNGSPPR